jgi:hypothetical protein
LIGDVEPMVTTIGYGVEVGTSPESAALTLGTIATGAQGPFPPNVMSNQYSFEGTDVVQNVGGAYFTSEDIYHSQGSANSGPLPQNCAFLIHKLTNTPGRKGRGRMFLPPFYADETTVTPTGFLTNPDGFSSLWNNFRTAIVDHADFTGFFVLHADGSTPSAIHTFRCDDRVATQRRRLR